MFRFTKLLLSSFFLIGLLCPAAHALQELGLVAEVQLPGSGPWDLQHWLDDSTYGWAQAVGNSAVFSFHLGNDIGSVAIPDSGAWGDGPYEHSFLKLLCDSTQDRNPLLSVTSKYYALLGNMGYFYRTVFDPVMGDQVLPVIYYPWYSSGITPSDWHEPHKCNVWPPPPNSSRYLAQSFQVEWSYDGAGDGEGRYSECVFSNIWNPWTCIQDAFGFQFFNSHTLSMACVSFRYHAGYYDDGPHYETFGRATIRSFLLNHQCASTQIDTACFESFWVDGLQWPHFTCATVDFVAAQTDSFGTQRVIRSDGHCSDANTGDSLWSNSAIVGWISAALLPTSPDERVIRYSETGRFEIFDASNGEFLDSTSTVLGVPQYLIRLPGRIAEVVTYDTPTYTVRIYKPIQRVTDLTIRYDADIESILLDWSTVPNAHSYKIYSANGYGEPESLLGTVYGGTLFGIPLDPSVRAKTFYVTANF